MKLLKVIFENAPLFEEKIEIDFFSEGRVNANEKHELIHLFKNFYANRTMTFTGLNAAGKTQVLNMLVVALNIIQAKSINKRPISVFSSFESGNILHLNNDEEVRFTIYFYTEVDGVKKINRLESVISRNYDETESEYRYFFVSEVLLTKEVRGIRSKRDIFDFSSEKSLSKLERNQNDQSIIGLSHDVSIINILINSKKVEKLYCRDMLGFTNFNVLSRLGNIPSELLSYLDPSIEKLDFIRSEESKTIRVSLKFVDQSDSIELESVSELHNILSSGTVKGIGLFIEAFQILRYGGVILVDELENHFNREIVSTFINLFLNRKTNPNGAILVYSTHYSELLDLISRNDSIYLVSKAKYISLEKFSSKIKRKDLSLGDIFIKGLIGNTTPKYSSEESLKKVFNEKFLTPKAGQHHDKSL